jgi:hypothetical protein
MKHQLRKAYLCHRADIVCQHEENDPTSELVCGPVADTLITSAEVVRIEKCFFVER